MQHNHSQIFLPLLNLKRKHFIPNRVQIVIHNARLNTLSFTTQLHVRIRRIPVVYRNQILSINHAYCQNTVLVYIKPVFPLNILRMSQISSIILKLAQICLNLGSKFLHADLKRVFCFDKAKHELISSYVHVLILVHLGEQHLTHLFIEAVWGAGLQEIVDFFE